MIKSRQPTLLLHNAKILTLNGHFPSASAMAIRDDRIVGVGNTTEWISSFPSEIERIDLDQRCILPGFTDSHIHMSKYAQSINMIDCETSSINECLQRVKARVAKTAPQHWILGHGWNQNFWTRYGTSHDLDRISTAHPIYLTAKSLHAGWANSKVLQLAGINSSTPDPAGGEIQRDSKGNPTGILFENAMRLVAATIPYPSEVELAELILTAQENLWNMGLTGVHDFDGPDCFRAYQRLQRRGQLGLRVLKNIPVDKLSEALAIGLAPGFGNSMLQFGNIKIFSDGALGPRTAAMLETYVGEENNLGMLLLDDEQITALGLRAAQAGFGLTIHAIGDRANHVVLNAYDALRKAEAALGLPKLRHRIEHLQLVHPQDLNRTAALNIIASMQPIHAISDMEMADRFWGDRSNLSYAWNSLLNSGAVLAFGSDAPVESPNPFLGISAAVTRKKVGQKDGGEGWIPKEKITLAEAISAYTFGPAYASYREHELGKIEPGYYADLIVLEENPFDVDPNHLYRIQPCATMVAGQWRYRTF